MKLEFLKNINQYDEHAIRLSDFDSAQAILFRDAITRLLKDAGTPIDLATLGFIQCVNCSMTLRVSSEDGGISTSDQVNFFCDLTRTAYEIVTTLLYPFCSKESKRYQWLYDLDTPIGFLFSSGTDLPDIE
jgi:hypothetical protein